MQSISKRYPQIFQEVCKFGMTMSVQFYTKTSHQWIYFKLLQTISDLFFKTYF